MICTFGMMHSKEFALLATVLIGALQLASLGVDAQLFRPSTSTLPFGGTNIYCPSGLDGLFADPANCSQYFECQAGQLTFIHQCPRGLYWLPTSVGNGYCVVQSQAQCRQPLSDYPQQPGGGDGQYGGGGNILSFVCPLYLTCNRTSLNGFYADPANCSRYYLCVDSRATLLSCPSGTTWSDRLVHCDWPYRTGCEPSRQPLRNGLYQCANAYGNTGSDRVARNGFFWMVASMVLSYLIGG